MAAVDVGARNGAPAPAADDLDDLFNYDVGDIFCDVDTNIDVPTQQEPAVRADRQENVAGLGIDEEIKVIKKRAPVPKLDGNRLLGPAGIPKLRRITKDRLNFKGKGHEYPDVSRLLSVYQLWLDELYPRAKFADGLAMIEKLGHSKRMQTMRREWINEGKPKERFEDMEHILGKQKTSQPTSHSGSDQSMTADFPTISQTPPAGNDEDHMYAATPKVNQSPTRRPSSPGNLFVSDEEDVGDRPPDDDLDVFLPEDQAKPPTSNEAPLSNAELPRRDDYFHDEMEAMAGMKDIW